MREWYLGNFAIFWNDKSCCYNLPFLFKNSKSIDIHDVSYGKFLNCILFKHSIHETKLLILCILMSLKRTFHKFTTKLYYILYTSFLHKTTHLRVIFNLNIYIIVWNNEMCSISWIQNYVCKRRRKMVSFIFMTKLNDIHLMFKSWEIWDNSIVERIAKILPYAT